MIALLYYYIACWIVGFIIIMIETIINDVKDEDIYDAETLVTKSVIILLSPFLIPFGVFILLLFAIPLIPTLLGKYIQKIVGRIK